MGDSHTAFIASLDMNSSWIIVTACIASMNVNSTRVTVMLFVSPVRNEILVVDSHCVDLRFGNNSSGVSVKKYKHSVVLSIKLLHKQNWGNESQLPTLLLFVSNRGLGLHLTYVIMQMYFRIS